MSLSERLANGIVDIIRDEHLTPGQALASSRDLAKRFAVTTPTIREALRRLEATGIVEFRHGSGTYVGAGIHRRVLANPHRPPLDRESALELVDARLVLEPAVAAAAARARTPESLARLESALHSTAGAAHFHVALAAATGNSLLAESVAALLDVRVHQPAQRRDDRERDHAEILTAVRDGDATAAETLTRQHLQSIRTAMETADSRTP